MNNVKIVSYGAIITAISVVLTMFGGIIPAAAFIAPIIAGFVLVFMKLAFGLKNAFISFVAIVFLMFFLSPKKISAFSYLLLFGYYPILFDEFYKIKSIAIRFVVKFILFESIGTFMLFVGLKLASNIKGSAKYTILIIGGIILYNIFALVYDRFIYLFFIQYRECIANKIKKI